MHPVVGPHVPPVGLMIMMPINRPASWACTRQGKPDPRAAPPSPLLYWPAHANPVAMCNLNHPQAAATACRPALQQARQLSSSQAAPGNPMGCHSTQYQQQHPEQHPGGASHDCAVLGPRLRVALEHMHERIGLAELGRPRRSPACQRRVRARRSRGVAAEIRIAMMARGRHA